MKLAFLFPGQGSQTVGMGAELAAAFGSARAVFEEVDEVLDQRLFHLMRDGPIEELTMTENAQPALMAVSLATMAALAHDDIQRGVRGLCRRTLARRIFGSGGRRRVQPRRRRAPAAPQGSGDAARRPGRGRRHGLPHRTKADLALAEAAAAAGAAMGVCVVANDNNAGNVVISGADQAVALAIDKAKELGARAIPLNVSCPFHSPPHGPGGR